MNIFLPLRYVWIILIYLPLPILAVCLMRSKCGERKSLLQLLLLTALEYIGHPEGILEKAFDQVFSGMSNSILIVDYGLIVYRVILVLLISYLLWKKLNQKIAAVIILPILFLPGLIGNVWTTGAIAVVVYSFCIRGLRKKPKAEGARALLILACICVILTGVGEYGIGVEYNREKAFMFYILGNTFSETDPDMEISYYRAAVKYDPSYKQYLDEAVQRLEGY